jgi:subtilase family serine protease
VVHPRPGAGGVCVEPGVVPGYDLEAAVDIEWASAAAPNATIVLASCADTDTNSGLFIALQNLVTGSTTTPAVMSMSYGSPESETGADFNAYINSLYQLAVFEGVSIFVSSGDEGAAGSDSFQNTAFHGINVNSFASTPNNVAVGGTDFGDTFFGANATYWNATNGPNYNSAKSYVPEIPWNDSCAGQLLATYVGYAVTYGASGFCNSPIGQLFLSTGAGSGGPSACASGESTIAGVVNGTCKGYDKPAFQKSLFGNPNDGVRDLPDVSLFAASGLWGHYFLLCYSNPAGGGVPCNTPPANWTGAGGTSFSAPIMAGIQALINQAAGDRQGNPDRVYYGLARSEYGANGSSACNSTLGNAVDPSCIFYDVTIGDMDVNCNPLTTKNGDVIGKFNCYFPKSNPGVNGVLSLSNTSYQPAYAADAGWDFATGIGTVNAYNLVANWPGSSLAQVKRKR